MHGKAVVVTGAASGIGRALATRFARAGSRVAVLDRDFEGAERVATELQSAGAEALPVECDVTDPEACVSAMTRVRETYGAIDVLINNAGITHLSRVADTDISVYRRVMDVNLFGAVHCTQAALPSLLERRGHVIVISSVAGFAPLAGRSGYTASKHALHGFFNTLRAEHAADGLRVLLVCPSFVATHIGDNALGAGGDPPARPRTEYGTPADPADVAKAIYTAAVRNRRLLIVGSVGKLAYAMTRVAPALYERMMVRRMLRA